MRSLAALMVALIAAACGCPPGSRCRTAADLYPSHNGDIPICPWMLEGRECASLGDLDEDGTIDLGDLELFCRRERDGDSLTLDMVSPEATTAWCYTCD